MTYLYLKAIHLVFVVTWFAGLFYIIRLFIYQTEAYEKPEQEKSILVNQFKIMSRRLWYGITWPSAIITLGMGIWLMINKGYFNFAPGWFVTKLWLLLGLYVYHIYSHKIFLDLQKDRLKLTSQQLRLLNEVATIFLITIVFVVVLRNTLRMVWGLVGVILLSLLLILAIYIYKKLRNKP